LRSFIAIELPESITSALAQLQQELKKSGADIRWVKPGNIHLTLKFLGDIDEDIVDDIVRVIKGTCNNYESFNLAIQGAGVFPKGKSPRVIWVGVNGNPSVNGIKGEIESGLTPLGFEQEKRKFTPHLTLGRFRSSRGKGSITNNVELLKDQSFGIMDVRAVSLMRSDLRPEGAQYTRIAELKLGERT
jgi:2'-5' RNA ligase